MLCTQWTKRACINYESFFIYQKRVTCYGVFFKQKQQCIEFNERNCRARKENQSLDRLKTKTLRSLSTTIETSELFSSETALRKK
jgi:hypothetical protein